MIPNVDLPKNNIVTSSQAFPTNPQYRYVCGQGKYFKVTEIAITGSNYTKTRFNVNFKGNSLFTENGQPAEDIELTKGLAIPFNSSDEVILEPNDSFDVSIRSTDGSEVSAQVVIIGTLLDVQEYKKLTGE